MGLHDFQASAIGRRIGELVASGDVIGRMEELSRRGQPAVGALDERLAGTVTLDNTERQYVGRWIKDVMAERGWQATIQRRLAGGTVLTSGMIYARRPRAGEDRFADVPTDLLPAEERIARAQAIVRQFSKNDFSVDDYLAEKWAEQDAELARDNAVQDS